MRRCLWPRVVQTQVAELNGTRGLAERRAGGIQHPGRGGAKTRGWSPACRGGSGRAARIQRRDPAPKLPLCPVAFPCGVFGCA